MEHVVEGWTNYPGQNGTLIWKREYPNKQMAEDEFESPREHRRVRIVLLKRGKKIIKGKEIPEDDILPELSIQEVLENEGFVDATQLISERELGNYAGYPSTCPHSCGDVEPDGECFHGYPSILLKLGIM